MQKIWQKILAEAFCMEPQPFWFLLRWACALALIVEYMKLMPVHVLGFSPQGFAGVEFLSMTGDPFAIGRPLVVLNQYVHWLPEQFIFLMHVTVIAAAWLFLFGVYPRVSGALALAMHFFLHARNEYFFWGWADLLKPILFYALLTPAIGCSMRAALSSPPKSWRLIRVVLLLHVALIYFVAAVSRFDNVHWFSGTALQRVLVDGQFARWPDLARHLPSYVLAGPTWLFWLIEMAAPVALLINRFRLPITLLLICMHALLELTTMVGWWNYLMVAALIVCLSEENRRTFRKWLEWYHINKLGL